MSRRLPARRRRNPDEDVLFPYAERFSSETFPSLATPDYSTGLVARRGATARAPSQVDGNLVFDAFFGEGMFEDFLTNPRRRKFEEEDGSVFLLARSSAHFFDRAHERLKRYHVAAMVESRKNLRPLQNALKAYGEWVIEGNEAVSRYSMSLSEAENLAKSVAAGLGLSLHEVGGKITRFQTSEKPGRAKPYPAEEYMDNPRRRNGVAEYQRRLAKQAAAAKQMKKISSKKRGGPLLRQVAVSEREDGFHVVLLFRDPTSAMDGETELQMHADWVRDFNEIETEHPMSRAEAMRLANEVAAEYRYGRAGKIVVYPLRRSKAKKVSSLKRRPAAGARVTYAAEEYMDNPRRTHRSNPLKGSVEGNFLVSRGDDGRVRSAMRLSDVVAVDLYKHSRTNTLYTQVKATDGVNIYVEDTPEEVLRLVEGRTRSNPAKKAPAKRRAAAASRATSKAAHLGKATAEVMHEDGAYEVITSKGKKFAWEDLRRIVGGDLLEFVPLGGGRVMVVNEEGMMRGMDINPGASLLVRTSIFGPAVVLARNAL